MAASLCNFVLSLKTEINRSDFSTTKQFFTKAYGLQRTDYSCTDYMTVKAIVESLKSLTAFISNDNKNEVIIQLRRHFTCREIMTRCIAKQGVMAVLLCLMNRTVGNQWTETHTNYQIDTFAILFHLFLHSFPPPSSLQSMSLLACHSYGIEMPTYTKNNITFTTQEGLSTTKNVQISANFLCLSEEVLQSKFELLEYYFYNNVFTAIARHVELLADNYVVLEDRDTYSKHIYQLCFFWSTDLFPELEKCFHSITHYSFITSSSAEMSEAPAWMPDFSNSNCCWKVRLSHPFDSEENFKIISEFNNLLSARTEQWNDCTHKSNSQCCIQCLHSVVRLRALKTFVIEEMNFWFQQLIERNDKV